MLKLQGTQLVAGKDEGTKRHSPLLWLNNVLARNDATGNDLSHPIRKPTICLCENKDADQLCSNCTADQRLCFHYTDNTIPLLLKSEISCFCLL